MRPQFFVKQSRLFVKCIYLNYHKVDILKTFFQNYYYTNPRISTVTVATRRKKKKSLHLKVMKSTQ